MSNEITTTTRPEPQNFQLSMFANAELFALVQRQAQLIAGSDLIPKQFQGNVPNCAIALEMAARLGASPFAVIQNLDVIHGRPSWRSVFLMGLVNSCGRFTPLQFKQTVTGPEKTVNLEYEVWEGPQGNRKKTMRKLAYTYTPTTCVAWAKDKSTGEVIEGPPASYDMAIEEGWVAKDGSKWQTALRSTMLIYRAASFFAKVYASDVMLGMQTAEEAYDMNPPMRDVTPPHACVSASDPIAAAVTGQTTVESTQEPPAAKRTQRTAKPAAEKPAEAEAGPQAAAPEEPEADGTDIPFDEEPERPTRPQMVADITELISQCGLTSIQAETIFFQNRIIPTPKLKGLDDDGLFKLWQNREILLQHKAATEGEG